MNAVGSPLNVDCLSHWLRLVNKFSNAADLCSFLSSTFVGLYVPYRGNTTSHCPRQPTASRGLLYHVRYAAQEDLMIDMHCIESWQGR